MIELDDKSYIVGMWFSEDPITGDNWMACVIADPEKKGYFKGWARTRFIKDNKIFDSDDEKRWQSFESRSGQTENYMINTMSEIQASASIVFKKIDKIIVKGNLKKLMKLSKNHPWMNIKCVDAKDIH